MLRTVFGNYRTTRNERYTLTGVSSLSISNPGETDFAIIIQGVRTIVPFWDKTKTVVPIQFDIHGDGTLSDVELEIEFLTGAGDAIIYFRQQKPE